MRYQDLYLKKLYETTTLDLAHWNCQHSCSCCITPDDFPTDLWRDNKIPETWDNVKYLIFKIAHNVGQFENTLPTEYDIICKRQLDYYKSSYYPIHVMYGGITDDELTTICQELQNLLGNDYIVYIPNTQDETIVIVHRWDSKSIAYYDNEKTLSNIKN